MRFGLENEKLTRSRQNATISISRQTKSVGKFVQVAYPELCNLDECVVESQILLPSSESMR